MKSRGFLRKNDHVLSSIVFLVVCSHGNTAQLERCQRARPGGVLQEGFQREATTGQLRVGRRAETASREKAAALGKLQAEIVEVREAYAEAKRTLHSDTVALKAENAALHARSATAENERRQALGEISMPHAMSLSAVICIAHHFGRKLVLTS